MKEIPGFENYKITTDGRIWSLFTSRFLSQKTDINGYKIVALYSNRKRHEIGVHRLVLWTYVGIQNNGIEVRHKNSKRSDNRLCNLEYGTRSDNAIDRVKHGNNSHNKGENNPMAKLTQTQVDEIREKLNYGYAVPKLAEQYNISIPTIRAIKNFKSWK